jgi:hypothetical protein
VLSYITPQPGGPLRRQGEGKKRKNASVLQVEDRPVDEALPVLEAEALDRLSRSHSNVESGSITKYTYEVVL